MLRFVRLPARAIDSVRDVLDSDEAFRRRVAESADEDSVGRASWLFLTRPDGWEAEFELLRAAADEELEHQRADQEEQRAQRRTAQLEEALERLRGEVAELRESLESSREQLAAEQRERSAIERTHAALVERAGELEDERSRAVRSLKDTEATAVARLAELRALQERLAEVEASVEEAQPITEAVTDERRVEPPGAVAPRSAWESRDPAAVADAVRRAGAAAELLAAGLVEIAEVLGSPPEAAASPPEAAAVAPTDPAGESARPPRRSPVRMRQGLSEDTPDGLDQLLHTPRLVVLVDGYNVSKTAWGSLDPAAQRSSLISALGALGSRVGATIHAVFDGDAEGGRPSVSVPLPVRVHFTSADVEADDLILAMVADLPTDVPVAVVSSDRRVADGARRLGANAVRSETLLGLIGR